mmetsp:Transcript_13073/g.34566  ORF Transcript_13073/g.34566 Transcript_13073/m.34566 type:complete len:248 (-) Transcript_13073:24-767(-)
MQHTVCNWRGLCGRAKQLAHDCIIVLSAESACKVCVPPPSLSGVGEHEDGLLVRELAVDCRVGRQLALHVVLVLVPRVQEDLQDLGAIHADARALADDLGGAHQVLENRLVHRGEGPGTRPHLQPLAAEVLVQDRAVRDEDDVLLVELLLKLADEPPLDLLHRLPHAEREVDDNRFPALPHVHLLRGGDGDLAQLGLDVARRRHLDVEQRLGHLLLQLGGGRALLLHNLLPSVDHREDSLGSPYALP